MTLDSWQEVLDVLRRNKLRTGLTALSVAWGIFMLVLLIAAGNGLRHSAEHGFRHGATNSIVISAGRTALPFAGHASGRPIRFANSDLEAVRREVSGVERLSGRYFLGALVVSRGEKSAALDVSGCHPDFQYLERTIVRQGRFINDLDVSERRKVAVLGPSVQAALFGKANPVGEIINMRGVNYKVVGVFEDEGGDDEGRRIYIPVSTAQLVYHGSDRLHQIMYTTGSANVAESQMMEQNCRQLLATSHHFDPRDRRAVQLTNNLAQFQKLMDIFDWIQSFVWLVSIGTLFAGIVGVSNIMIISVQERTREIGIRKAVGATPWSIVNMILTEALLLTGTAGYVGLSAGVLLVETLRRHLPENDYVRNPTLDLRVALVATAMLIGAGALAGLLPAVEAARVRPVTAMREI